jgi:hypothetical protein
MQNRPLEQFNVALLQLQRKITSGSGLQKAGHALIWKFSKEEVEGILLRTERLKSLIQMALETDHLSVTHLSRGCIVRLITFSANSLKPSRTTPKAQEQESKRFSMVKIGFRKVWIINGIV